MPEVMWVPVERWLQYDGANSPEILAAVLVDQGPAAAVAIVSEAAGVLAMDWSNDWTGTIPVLLNAGEWVRMPFDPMTGSRGVTTESLQSSRSRLSDLSNFIP